MAGYAVIEDWQSVEGEFVLDVTIRQTEDEVYTNEGVEYIEFPGMLELYDRFRSEAEEMTPIDWDWPKTV